MKAKLPPYTHGFIDRHGKPRFYLRKPGRKRLPLPGLPWAPEFMEARQKALNGDWAVAVPDSMRRVKAGTLNAALVSYFHSTAFATLSDGTRKSRRAILEQFRTEHGDKRIADLSRRPLQVILNKKSPAAQRNWRKALRGFVDHCLALDMIGTDPLAGLSLAKLNSKPHHPWTADEISRYEHRHEIGTRERLALELLLSTGQARCDVVRMGEQYIKAEVLSMARQKTGVAFDIPVLPSLRAAIDALPESNFTFLLTEHGKPFTAAGFGNWFRDRCNEAGLPQCSAHGLRSAAATRLAEYGASGHQLMAWFAWRTLSEAERYTNGADRKRLAAEAGKLITGTGIGKPENQFAKNGRKALKNNRGA